MPATAISYPSRALSSDDRCRVAADHWDDRRGGRNSRRLSPVFFPLPPSTNVGDTGETTWKASDRFDRVPLTVPQFRILSRNRHRGRSIHRHANRQQTVQAPYPWRAMLGASRRPCGAASGNIWQRKFGQSSFTLAGSARILGSAFQPALDSDQCDAVVLAAHLAVHSMEVERATGARHARTPALGPSARGRLLSVAQRVRSPDRGEGVRRARVPLAIGPATAQVAVGGRGR